MFAIAILAALAATTISGDGGSFRSSRATALAPNQGVCSGGGSFCGAVLRIQSSAGTIPSVAAGSHYGAAWGIPPSPNDSTGTGWCVDDTHTGFPAGPITEQPLPSVWSSLDHRIAATIVALYGGDRVLPYQPMEVDDHGELTVGTPSGTTPTRLRHLAVWLALRSVLADPAGTPRIDLASATTFSDRAGRRPSALGNAAVPVARQMVDVARRMTVDSGHPNVDIRVDAEQMPTEPGDTVSVPVRLTDSTGRPIAHAPVWVDGATNVAIAPKVPADGASLQAFRNAERAGWPSFDTTGARTDATVTDANGIASFDLQLLSYGNWSASFTTETAPTRLRLFGDDIRAQNNVTLRGGEANLASAAIGGDASLRHLRIVKTTTDDDFSVAGATFTVVDANDTEVGRATTGDEGSIDIVVTAAHRPPFRIREIEAPPGLRAIVEAIVIGDDEPLSTDPDQPTVVAVENQPELHDVSLAKRVLDAPEQPDDLSGFTFTLTRRTDRSDVTTVVTGPDGRTPTAQLVAGEYDVAEIARPEWWPGDDPLPTPATLTVPRDTHEPIVFTFDNTFPAPPTTTTTSTTTTTTTTPPAPTTTVPPTTTTVAPSTSTTPTSPTTLPAPTIPPTTTATTVATTTTTTLPPATTPPPTSAPPSTPAPTTTTTTTTAAPPTPEAPGRPPLPRTGGEMWRLWYRIGSFVVLAGALLFFVSTIGLGSRQVPARLPGTDVARHREDDAR